MAGAGAGAGAAGFLGGCSGGCWIYLHNRCGYYTYKLWLVATNLSVFAGISRSF